MNEKQNKHGASIRVSCTLDRSKRTSLWAAKKCRLLSGTIPSCRKRWRRWYMASLLRGRESHWSFVRAGSPTLEETGNLSLSSPLSTRRLQAFVYFCLVISPQIVQPFTELLRTQLLWFFSLRSISFPNLSHNDGAKRHPFQLKPCVPLNFRPAPTTCPRACDLEPTLRGIRPPSWTSLFS